MTPARQRALILGLIITGMVFAGYFGLRTLHAFRDFRGHRPPPIPVALTESVETNVDLIREWMTIPYISSTYYVPQYILFDAVGISSEGNEEKSLEALNREYFPNANEIVIAKIKAAVPANRPPIAATSPAAPTPP